LLEKFFIDAYSIDVSRERPRDYLFSAVLSSDQLFYPVDSKDNIEAILYPSVQRKKMGQNFAIKNDLIFEKYDLTSVETKFILHEYDDLNPISDEPTTDSLIGSFGTEVFDFEKGKILYSEDAPRIFELFRRLQISGGKQTRYDAKIKSMPFNLSPKGMVSIPKVKKLKKKNKLYFGRNERVNVEYNNSVKKLNIKYKLVKDDLEVGICVLFE